MVLIGHSVTLTLGEGNGRSPLDHVLASLAGTGVDVFFALSGYLVFASLVRSPSLPGFAWRRIVRIYPGLIASVTFCVLFIGPVATSLSLEEFFTSSTTAEFFLGKATLLGLLLTGGGSELPGVFQNAPFPGAVNASLWTLPWEVMMYAMLAFIALACNRLTRRAGAMSFASLAIIVGGIALHGYTLDIGSTGESADEALHIYLPAARFCVLFFSGAVIAQFGILSRLPAAIVLLLCILTVTCRENGAPEHAIYLLTLPLIVINLGESARLHFLKRFNRVGDYSYGIYIFAFPIQQMVVSARNPASPEELTLISLPIVLFVAAMSWHLIEKPCLTAKKRFDSFAFMRFSKPETNVSTTEGFK